MITELVFLDHGASALIPRHALAREACRQLTEYLADPGFRFHLPLKMLGTVYQNRVWRAISEIPCGSRLTYSDIARHLRSSPRAVGQACGSNAFPLIIPCHRVVAASGLGGFAQHAEGYLPRIKRWLLAHESGQSSRSLFQG